MTVSSVLYIHRYKNVQRQRFVFFKRIFSNVRCWVRVVKFWLLINGVDGIAGAWFCSRESRRNLKRRIRNWRKTRSQRKQNRCWHCPCSPCCHWILQHSQASSSSSSQTEDVVPVTVHAFLQKGEMNCLSWCNSQLSQGPWVHAVHQALPKPWLRLSYCFCASSADPVRYLVNWGSCFSSGWRWARFFQQLGCGS